jgi:hypothetical protein
LATELILIRHGVISAALSWFLPEQRWKWWRKTVSNCSMTRFSVEGSRVKLLAVNDILHLSPVIITTKPPTVTVEIPKEVHPVEKGLVFDKTLGKSN